MLTEREVRIAEEAGISALQYFGEHYCFRHFRDCFSWALYQLRANPELFNTAETFKEGFLISKRAAKAYHAKYSSL